MNWNRVNLKAKNKNLPNANEPVLWATSRNAPSEGVFYKFVGWLNEDGKHIEATNKLYELNKGGWWWAEMSDPISDEEIVTLEDMWGDKHKARLISDKDEPYLVYEYIEKTRVQKYNPNYGDNRKCVCGHTYYRHFDSWENMEPVGCKYCGCDEFVEAIEE